MDQVEWLGAAARVGMKAGSPGQMTLSGRAREMRANDASLGGLVLKHLLKYNFWHGKKVSNTALKQFYLDRRTDSPFIIWVLLDKTLDFPHKTLKGFSGEVTLPKVRL